MALRERSDLTVLFVLVDTLRTDRVHVYGHERETSPNLDALAANGLRFCAIRCGVVDESPPFT